MGEATFTSGKGGDIKAKRICKQHWHNFPYINVNIGDQLGCNVHTSLFDGAVWQIWIAVPAAADGVGVRGGWGGMLDTSGGHNPDGFTLRTQKHNQNHDQGISFLD